MFTSTCVVSLLAASAHVTMGQLSENDLAAIKARARDGGWTFSVGANPATKHPIHELCGLNEPADWRRKAPPRRTRALMGDTPLPASYDWRSLNGCTPIRDQGGCGSCWAFGTVGVLESAIKIKDNMEVDLSEQWLVSCNQDGYGCGGGWWAHHYHLDTPDFCGGTGAVFESSFPYAAADLPCACSYSHEYWITAWGYVDPARDVPDVNDIKRAIIAHGPVAVAVSVNSAFQAYTGGVFNSSTTAPVNHAVVLVGWDDGQGPGGVWFLRNSWGTGWGENGYMRIRYGCSSVGYAAPYIEYAGSDPLRVTPSSGLVSTGPVGGPFSPASQTYTLTNTGETSLSWIAAGAQAWLDVTPASGTLGADESATVEVRIGSAADGLTAGTYTDAVTFTNTTSGAGRSREVTLRVGPVDYFTEAFQSNDNDLSNRTVSFVPDGSNSYYTVCGGSALAFPTDPAGGLILSLGDDDFAPVTLSGGAHVQLYGRSYSSFYVGSNGYITFEAGDTQMSESLSRHFGRPRISGLFDDLDPQARGTVSVRQLEDRAVVTFEGVPEYGRTGVNSFQIELFFSGKIRMTWLGIAATDGVVGLSAGAGQPVDFAESDISAYAPCDPTPPAAQADAMEIAVNSPTPVTLRANDDGLPNPPGRLTYVITRLPVHGALSDPGSGLIASIPYTLVNGGKVVRYSPTTEYVGTDSLAFRANDGGMPPQGGDSNEATVSLAVVDHRPAAPTNPRPSDGALAILPIGELRWDGDLSSSAVGAVLYDVYLGTQNPPSTLLVANLRSLAYGAGVLQPDAVYYWKVVAKNDHGQRAGPVWWFRTVRALSATIAVAPSAIALGEAATLTAVVSGGLAPYSVTWNTGQTGQSIVVRPDYSTPYAVTVRDSTGQVVHSAEARVTVTCRLTLEVVGPGEVVGAPLGTSDVERGSALVLTAVPLDSEVEFAGWTGSVVRTERRITVAMDSDKGIVAEFHAVQAAVVGNGLPCLMPAGLVGLAIALLTWGFIGRLFLFRR